MLLRSITTEREDIFKFFLFINIYGGINAFYDFLSLIIFISISFVKNKKDWREIIAARRTAYTPVMNALLPT